MKVLYLNLSLPDHRVEKTAYLAKKAGHTCYYAGGIEQNYAPSPIYGDDLFERYYKMEFSPKNILGMNLKSHVEQLEQIKDELDFDLIHANNVYCAFLADKIDTPIIFDDHEFFSGKLKHTKPNMSSIKKYLAFLIMKQRYPKWELKMNKKYPILTVSPKIVEGHLKNNPKANVFLVPNMPLLVEVKDIKLRTDDSKKILKTAYIGVNDFPAYSPYRNTNGVIEIWNAGGIGDLTIIGEKHLENSQNVVSLGRINQDKVFFELAQAHVGLIAWLPHDFHYFCGPNKIYNYVHCGLFLMYPHTLSLAKQVVDTFSNELGEEFGLGFFDYAEVGAYLKENATKILNLDQKEIMSISRKHFVLETCFDDIMKAYDLAIENY